ncbi:hypothetical protein [Lacinutrix jangbogonensis]|uniref:hypothetical protein n=1 Tax=Lacinutrix jangbogonensis TaxID=1469557 RepID=UPI00053F11CF|nr:hypothetical protein [Lacinutrix jangbogonensis]
MKKLILVLGFLGVCHFGNSQNDAVYVTNSNQYHDASQDYFKRVTFKIGAGVLLPQGNLKDYFGVSPLVELSLDFPVTQKKSLELALQFVVPDQKESFKYVRTIDTVQVKATFMFNPMLRFKKNISTSRTSQLHVGFGLGLSIIKTDSRNPFYTGSDEDNEKYEVVSAILASPSLDYIKTFKNNEQLTFSFGLNYSPYKVEGALRENIGSISLTPRIMYSF